MFPFFKNITVHIVLDPPGVLFDGIRTSAFHIYGGDGERRYRVSFDPIAMKKL